MSQLAPSQTSLVLFPELVAQKAETVIIKGKYISHSCDVTTTDGRVVLSVQAEVMSLSHRKHVYDGNGQLIFNIRKETWNLSGSRYWLESPTSDQKLFEMETHFSLSGTKFNVKFMNASTGTQEELFFKNNPFGKHGSVLHGVNGPSVADIDQEWLTLRREYHVTVAQGVDIGLIVGMILCIDDREQSNRETAAIAV